MRRLAFWAAAATVTYGYILFPLISFLRPLVLRRPIRTAAISPTVSLLIAARNEEAVIRGRIENLLALDYPARNTEIIIVSDGSDDRTDQIVREYSGRGVRLLAPGRVGKGPALGLAVEASRSDILVFSDANSLFRPDAVEELVAPFADPAVGGVAGDQRYFRSDDPEGIAHGERGYWNYDRFLKRAQSASGSVTGATGAIYAIRRELFRPIAAGVTDDLFTSLQVIRAGRRLVFAPRAVAYERVIASRERGFARKVRIMSRSLRGVFVNRAAFDARRFGFYSVQLLSQKVLLRMMAIPLGILAVTSALLWRRGRLYRVATLGQALFYGAGLAGLATAGRKPGRSRLLGFPAYFCLVNAASLVALWNLVRGRRIDRWEPRRPPDNGFGGSESAGGDAHVDAQTAGP